MSLLNQIFEPVLVWLSYYINSIIYWGSLKLAVSGLILYIVALFWWVDVAIKWALIIYFSDFLLWIALSLFKWTFNLVRFWQGIAKLWLFIVWLIVTNQWDILLQDLIWYGWDFWFKMIYVKSWFVLYFWIHELLSLLKKLDSIPRFPLPRWMIKKLNTYKEWLDNK